MSEIKWAVLGCGVIANEAAAALKAQGKSLYAVGNRTREKAVSFAEKYGISKVYDDFNDMFFDPAVDVIYITTPHNTHIDFIKKAVENGKHVLVEKSITLNSAELSEAVLMFEERAKHEEKRLIYEEPDLVAPIEGDRNRLRQVFVNIIDNALKYSDRGDTVTIKADMRDGNIRITVADTGCGIREQDLPKVKEKFFKANSTRRGSGIGLAVADEIVAMHGGSLELTSKENVGTRVTILLPTGKS